MNRIVIYLTRAEKLNNTDCKRLFSWEDKSKIKVYSTKSNNEHIVFLSDALDSQQIENKFKFILSYNDQYAIVHHKNMTVKDKSFLNFKIDGAILIGDQFGRHESSSSGATKELIYQIYNTYLYNILNSKKELLITSESFEELWQIFEKKSELELALNLLHDIYSGKPKNEFESNEYKALSQKPKIKERYTDLVNSMNEGKYDHSSQEKLIALRDEILLLSITNRS